MQFHTATQPAARARFESTEPNNALVDQSLGLTPQLIKQRIKLCIVRAMHDVTKLVQHRAQSVLEVEEAIRVVPPSQPYRYDGAFVLIPSEQVPAER